MHRLSYGATELGRYSGNCRYIGGAHNAVPLYILELELVLVLSGQELLELVFHRIPSISAGWKN